MRRCRQFFYLGMAWLFLHISYIVLDGFFDDDQEASVVIVLGSTVNEDGSLSKRLKGRLVAGLSLYEIKLIDTFYVSGGLGKEGHLEGDKMKAFLVKKGVPKEIVVDNKGDNTRATAVNFKRDFPKVDNVYVVSQFFHITRSKLALSQVGVPNVYSTHSTQYEVRDVYSILRECVGYYAYLIKY